MKPIFKKLLNIGEGVLVDAVPGAGAVTSAIHGALDKTATGSARELAAVAAAVAAIDVLEHELGGALGNEPDFQRGILQLNADLLLVLKAVQARHARPT